MLSTTIEPQKSDATQLPIVIAGMGPAGLAAAIEAARKGYTVSIIEPRVEMTRGQRVQIDSNTFNFLNSLENPSDPKDTQFFENKISRNGAISVEIKDIQRFLLRKIGNYPTITTRLGYQITNLDPSNQTVNIKNEKEGEQESIPFSHFVEADGANHPTANLLNKDAKQECYKIQFKNIEYQPRQEESGTISLRVKPEFIKPMPANLNKFKLEDLARLRKYGWSQPYFPKVYILSNQKNTKLFIGSEVPTKISKLANKVEQRKELIVWETHG